MLYLFIFIFILVVRGASLKRKVEEEARQMKIRREKAKLVICGPIHEWLVRRRKQKLDRGVLLVQVSSLPPFSFFPPLSSSFVLPWPSVFVPLPILSSIANNIVALVCVSIDSKMKKK